MSGVRRRSARRAAKRWRCRARSLASGLLRSSIPAAPPTTSANISRSTGRSCCRCSSARSGRSCPKPNRCVCNFPKQAGEPRQFIGEPTAWSLPIIDVSAEPDPRAAAETWMQADLARPIDPVVGPLFGFALFKASATRFFWYARYHHIVLDGFRHVARRPPRRRGLHRALCRRDAARRRVWFSSRRCSNEDAAYRASGQLDADRRYWREALAARPEPGSLTLSSRPSSKPGHFLRATAYVPSSCEMALRTLAARSRTTLARVMTAATAMFLHRLAGADDVVIGVPVAARSADARRIPGMASNVLPLRLALQPGMTVVGCARSDVAADSFGSAAPALSTGGHAP